MMQIKQLNIFSISENDCYEKFEINNGCNINYLEINDSNFINILDNIFHLHLNSK